MLARCFQHETDHLDGILFTDRLEGEDRKAALRSIRNANYDSITESTTAKRAKTVGSSFGGGSFGPGSSGPGSSGVSASGAGSFGAAG
jgi:peptide deformylase